MKLFESRNVRLTESVRLPEGYFIATEDFELSPRGGWNIKIKKGSVIKVTKDEKMLTWDALGNDWKNRVPPIQGRTNLAIGDYGASDYMLNTFKKNVFSTTEAKAKEAISKMTAEKTMKVKDAGKFLSTLDGNQNIKITLIN